MSIYKEASKTGMRVQTSRGNLTVEQLWDLPVKELDALAVKLEKEHEDSKGKSFLDKKTTKDKGIKLQFDVVLDILETKVAEAEAAAEAKETKDFNNKILELIEEKKDTALKGKTIAQLKAMLK